jgi:UDP-glucose 4-epimerase
MKILVTGGAGYIGSACVDSLVKAGHSVVVFDDLSTGQSDKVSSEAMLLSGSLTDSTAIMQVCEEYQFDAVMHFAAKKAVGESEINPTLYYETNLVGTFNLLRAMEKANIPKLIFSSTAAVYRASADGLPATEETPTNPVSVYGTTKLMVEDMIRSYQRTGKLKQFSILRYFNVAGDAGLDYKEDNAQNVFPLIARTIGTEKPFIILGTDYETIDGTGVRDYIHLKDLVDAHIFALLKDASGTYNLGTGVGYSVRQLVAAFNAKLPKPLNVVEAPRRLGDAPVVVADASLAEETLGWKPKHTLADMVEDTLRVYRK